MASLVQVIKNYVSINRPTLYLRYCVNKRQNCWKLIFPSLYMLCTVQLRLIVWLWMVGCVLFFFSIQRLLLSTLALYSNQGSLGREGEGAGIKVSNWKVQAPVGQRTSWFRFLLWDTQYLLEWLLNTSTYFWLAFFFFFFLLDKILIKMEEKWST